jgi:hypothetical protein
VQPPRFENTAQIVEGPNFELLVEQLDPLRPEPGKGGNLTELAGQLLFQRIEESEMAGIDNAGDLFSQILADAGKFRQSAPVESMPLTLCGNASTTLAARR